MCRTQHGRNMGSVDTVNGPIDTADLGRTLMHEHVFVLSTEIQDNYPQRWGTEESRIDDAVRQLDELKESGIDTIVDLSVLGHGRCVPRVAAVAARTSVNIIVATGLYTFCDLPMYLAYRGPGTMLGGPEPMVKMFVRDIESGVADTGVRASILKCATDEPGLTPGVERVLRAVAQAHRRTGVPISTHTHAATRRGLDQQRIFADEGVDLTRVVIGHCGDTTDLAYLEQLMASGSFLGMDRFGVDFILSLEDRVATVARLCQRGHADQLVLSHDAACHIDWLGFDEPVGSPTRFTQMTDQVVADLYEAGVTEGQVRQMLIDNPRRIFEHQGAY